MISFHEGLPGAGKSYEACVYHIIPALLKGRKVVTNIEGINHQKFSEISGIPVAMVEQFLICTWVTTEEEPDEEKRVERMKQAMLDESPEDCLMVFDEINQYFPPGRQKLSQEWQKLITEHRHRGIDVVLMGQDRRDLHALWRRRIERVIVFLKLTAVGEPNRYRWEMFTSKGTDKYEKASGGTRDYESKYFGLYESITKDTKNVDVYADTRAVMFTKKHIYSGIAAGSLLAFVAIYGLLDFFDVVGDDTEAAISQIEAVGEPVAETKPQAVAVEPDPVERPPYMKPEAELEESYPFDYVIDRYENYEFRLGGMVWDPDITKRRYFMNIEVLDKSNHMWEVFTSSELQGLGWNIDVRNFGVVLSKGDFEFIVRPRPLEQFGQVNRRHAEAL